MADIALTTTKLFDRPETFQIKPTSDVDLTVSGGATPTAQSEAIDVRGAKDILLTVNHNIAGSDSTDLDAEVFASYDGTTFDNEAYVSMNLGASKVKSIPVARGPAYIRWKVTNNDASNATSVRPVVVLVRP